MGEYVVHMQKNTMRELPEELELRANWSTRNW